MKKTIGTTLAMLIAANLFAQNSLTNTISEFAYHRDAWFNSPIYISRMTEVFNTHIGAEIDTLPFAVLSKRSDVSSSFIYRFLDVPDMALTNTTLEEVISNLINGSTNHVWRYDCEKDMVYIHPVTNAISMTRIGAVSLKNEIVFELEKILGKYDLKFRPKYKSHKNNGNERDITQDKISLEFEDAYLYEILDAVVAQIPDAMGWTIVGKRITFHGKSNEKTIVTTSPAFIVANLFTQNSLTNTVVEFSTPRLNPWEGVYIYMPMISEAFNARINTDFDYDSHIAQVENLNSSGIMIKNSRDIADHYKFMSIMMFPEMHLTNATLEEVIVTVINGTTNHMWRYDSDKDILYVHPVTNAISMTRIGPVSFTNEIVYELGSIVGKYDLKLWPRYKSYKTNGNVRRISNDIISLEIEDAYLYEILDGVVAQIPDARGWTIMGKQIYFYGKNKD